MKIDVGDLLKRVGKVMRVEAKETLSLEEDGLSLNGPVAVYVKLTNIGDSILLSGKFKASVRLNCVRCLKDFDQPLSVEVEEEYSRDPKVFDKKGEEIELKDADFIFKIGEDNSIDLGEAIRQNILTALPIKPLCRKSCKGLPVQELAVEKGASKKAPDPRLAKLKDIMKRQ